MCKGANLLGIEPNISGGHLRGLLGKTSKVERFRRVMKPRIGPGDQIVLTGGKVREMSKKTVFLR